MSNLLVLPDLREMIAENDAAGLAQVVTELHPATIADFSEGLTVEETWQLLDHAPVARQADILSFFPSTKQVEMVTGAGRHLISKLLEAMPHDDRVELLRQLDPDVVEDLLPLVAKADREDIRRLLSYPEDSAGAMMTTDYAWLPRDLTVAQAIEDLRKQASDKETIYYIYVLDENRRMLGFVSLRHLILAKPAAKVADIMQTEVISVRVDADREEVVKLLQRYDFLAIPVVDEQHRLVGIITHDDAIDVVVEEATEDALHLGGVSAITESYLDAPFCHDLAEAGGLAGVLVRRGAVHVYRDGPLRRCAGGGGRLGIVRAAVISTGGNSGSQAATLITRALGGGRRRAARLVAGAAARTADGARPGRDAGRDRFFRAWLTPHSVLGGADPLVARAGDQPVRGVHLPVGHGGGLDAAAGVQAAGRRSRLRVEPVRGHVRRRDRDRDLLLVRPDVSAVTASPPQGGKSRANWANIAELLTFCRACFMLIGWLPGLFSDVEIRQFVRCG